MTRKLSFLLLTVIVLLQSGVMSYWASRKSLYHIDELYTFEYVQNINRHANHLEYMTGSPMWKPEEWIPVGDLKSRFTIEEGESVLDLPFSLSVKKFFLDRNYMWIINALESVFGKDVPPRWICIFFNILVWILFQFLLLYFLTDLLGLDRRTALLAVTMWGFCPVVLGFAVFCRFYSWTLLLFLAALVLHKLMWDSDSHKKNLAYELAAFVLLYLAFKNSELIIVLGGSLALFFTVGLVVRKRYPQALYYFVPITLGSLLYIGNQTSFLKVLFNISHYAAHGQGEIMEHASFLINSSFVEKLSALIRPMRVFATEVAGQRLLFLIVLLLFALLFFSAKKRLLGSLVKDFQMVLFGVIVVFWLFCGLGGFMFTRYYSFLFLLVFIFLWTVFDKLVRGHSKERLVYIIASCVVFAGALYPSLFGKIDYVYSEDNSSVEQVAAYKDLPSVVNYNMEINFNAYYSALLLDEDASVFPICDYPADGILPELPDSFLFFTYPDSSSEPMSGLIREGGYSVAFLCDLLSFTSVYLCENNE